MFCSKSCHNRAGIIDALVDAASDKDAGARGAIVKSVVDIGRKKYAAVLGHCHSYLLKHSKVRLKQLLPIGKQSYV